MKINVHEEAAQWYKDEMGLEEGESIRIFTKLYGGIATVFPNYFLGIQIGSNEPTAVEGQGAGITFYLTKEDDWILKEHDLEVKMGEDEAEFVFNERS
jgi:uncharacterized protein YneR